MTDRNAAAYLTLFAHTLFPLFPLFAVDILDGGGYNSFRYG